MPEESQLKVFATMYFDRVNQVSIPSGPVNSPCQSDISMVCCLSDTSAATSITSLRPQSLPCRRQNCTAFVISKSFRCNTYKKPGVGYPGRGTSFAVQVDATSLCSMSAHLRPVILRASDE